MHKTVSAPTRMLRKWDIISQLIDFSGHYMK